MLIIVLAAFVSAQNEVKPAGVKGVVRDSNGHPVTNATVNLQSKTPALSLTTHTDAQGVYTFSSLPVGSYMVRAETSPASQAQFGPFTLGPAEMKVIDLTLVPAASSRSLPAFYDEPQFTVAGVTQTGNAGGHGSDTVRRNSEALAKATASLSKQSEGGRGPTSITDLERTRAELRSRLIHEDTSELHHSLADVEESLSNPLGAVREYQRAAEMEPSEPYLFDWGAELLSHRAPEPAAQVFTRGHRLFPLSSRMLVGLAVAQYARGSYGSAAQSLFEASDLNPSDPTPYLFLGKMLGIETAELHGFVEKFARFSTLHPNNALASYYYAVSLCREFKNADPQHISRGDNFAKVKELLDKSVRLDPHLSVGYLQLGVLASDKGDLQEAISNYQRAIEIDSNSAEAYYRLAQAYRRAGRKDEAARELKTYQEVSKKTDVQVERERREMQQFVITLRNPSANAMPK